MVNVKINGVDRPDIWIETGGTLEQTSEHATSSSLALRVPVASDDLQDCDYIQLLDGDKIVFAGTVLKYTQRAFVSPPNFRIYDLDITSNTDYIASVYVDLGFPAGATISQILFGNAEDAPGYKSDMPQFPGVFSRRIAPEGISLGTVDDFSAYALSESSYLWGQTVKELLDNLCDIAGAWWEITPDKVFNMRYEYNLDQCAFSITPGADVFDVSVSKDALTFYSACRVVGGVGRSPTNAQITVQPEEPSGLSANAQYIWQSDLQTLETNPQILEAYQIIQTVDGEAPANPATPQIIYIGFEGINDDDPQYQALMTYGGSTIKLKDGYEFINLSVAGNKIVVENVVYQVDVYARVVDPGLCAEIADKRGGSGIVEYNLEDDSITSFSAAISAATDFLKNFAKRSVTISFSTFSSCAVGQKLTVRLPYYQIDDSYTITQLEMSFVLDRDSGDAIIQYNVTASNIKYRDPYKSLFYSAARVSFSLESNESPSDGTYIDNIIKITTITGIYGYSANTWDIIQQRARSWTQFQDYYPSWITLETSGTPAAWVDLQAAYPTWAALQSGVPSWAWLQSLNEEWYNIGTYLTDKGRQKIVQALNGILPIGANFFGDLTLVSSGGNINLSPSELQMTSNGGIATYYIAPNEANILIEALAITEGNDVDGDAYLSVPVDIDHTGQSTGGQYALTISMQTIIQ